MNLRTRVFALAVAGIMVGATSAEIFAYLAKSRVRRNAESLLAKVAQWRVGDTTWSETRELRIRYAAQQHADLRITGAPPEQDYSIELSSSSLNYMAFRFPVLWKLGVRPSGVLLEFRYRNQRLTYMRYSFYSATFSPSGAPTQLVAVVTETDADTSAGLPPYLVNYGERPSSFEPKGQEHGLGAILTRAANSEEQSAGFGFDLSCLSSVSGCRTLCEMMPSVWREAARQSTPNQIALPKEELGNPKCFQSIR